MAYIDSKYNIKIGAFGFLLARMPRAERYQYTREEAPAFVNKFSSGDPNYRDSTFFPHWVTLSWQNGFNQEYFDDGGKFYRSSGLDSTEQTKLTLEKAFNSAGQVVAGAKIKCAVALISSASTVTWANANYGYRKLITIVAPTGKTLPAGYPIKITEDTAALVTATKMLSNRNDLRIQYFNGSSWVDLSRDYVGTTETWFALQAQIDSGGTSTSYYLYYSYAAETTNKQPTTNATWNAVYTPANDTNTKGLWHFKETSGTTVADTSGNAHDITLTGGTWATGKFAKGVTFNGSSDLGTITDHADLKPTGSFTVEAWIKTSVSGGTIFQSFSQNLAYAGIYMAVSGGGMLYGLSGSNVVGATGVTQQDISGVTSIVNNVLHHVAFTWDGSNLKLYVDGVLDATTAWTPAPAYATTNYIRVGCGNGSGSNTSFFNGTIDGLRVINGTAITSFPHGFLTSDPTVTQGSEVAQASAPAASGYIVLAGADNGKIYKWDGATTWTQQYDTANVMVNCAVIFEISGVQYAYFGTGDPSLLVDGVAKIIRTIDGTTFTVAATLTGDGTASVTSLATFNGNYYAGVNPKAQVWKSTNGTTFTLSKDINEPSSPGWIWAMKVYNNKLYVGGGHPQRFLASNSAGFLYSYDDFEWKLTAPFDFTVIKSLEVYDSLLFIGTISKRLYVFNTASIDKILEFPWDVSINAMVTWQDKLVLALGATDENNVTSQESIYIFDRNGFHNAFDTSNAVNFYSLLSVSNILFVGTGASGYVYRTVDGQYQTTGTLQSSYFEAQLPSIYKHFRDVTLIYDSLPTGCSIAIDYRVDETGSWTNLGTANTPLSTKATFTYAVTVADLKVTYRITLTTTNVSSTPTLRKVLMRYVLSPDFKYLWKMRVACVDNIVWADATEPKAILGSAVTAGATSITLKSADVATPTSGFPGPAGETMYATIETSTGTQDVFTYTGTTSTTLTGIPATGANSLGSHSVNEVVKITGANMHQKLLDLKQTRSLYIFTDIDGLTYTVLFHSFQTENWSINQADLTGGLENEVPITLLQA